MNSHNRRIGLFLLLFALTALGARYWPEITPKEEAPARLRTIPVDVASGDRLVVKEELRACFGGDDFETVWKRDGESYSLKAQRKSPKDMAELRAIILSTRLSRDPLTEFNSLPTADSVVQRMTELYPWVEAEPPDFTEDQLEKWLRKVLAVREGSTSSYTVQVDLGGNPPITLGMSVDDPCGNFYHSLPNWEVHAGELVWATRSPRLNRALALWSPGARDRLKNLTHWPELLAEGVAELEGEEWAREYIRLAHKGWPGGDLFDNTKLEISLVSLNGCNLTVPLIDRVFDHVRVSYGPDGPRKDWNWLKRELLAAEATVTSHTWFRDLRGTQTEASVRFSTEGYYEKPWKNAGLPGRPQFEASIGGTSLKFSGPNGPALFDHAEYSKLATQLNGGTKIKGGELLIIYPDGRTVVKPKKA